MVGSHLGPYLLLKVIGSGAMGTVYRAEVRERTGQLERGAQVAIKVFHPHLLSRKGLRTSRGSSDGAGSSVRSGHATGSITTRSTR